MMPLSRVVLPETLDSLAESDPAAQRARRDLQRVHRVMRTRSTLLHTLRAVDMSLPVRRHGAALRVLELGAGDGSLLLGVARALAPDWPRVQLTLLDRQALVLPATLAAYAQLGWRAQPLQADVLDWAAPQHGAAGPGAQRWDVIIANLFLHHFEGVYLARLLGAVAARCQRFVACEPRRSTVALLASHAVGLIGANAVTRQDAVLSVHAGFRATELTAAWPGPPAAWLLRERSAGLFGHSFCADRTGTTRCAATSMR